MFCIRGGFSIRRKGLIVCWTSYKSQFHMFHHFTSSPSCWNHHPRGWATRRPNSPDLLLACPASAACAAALCVELLFQMRTRRMSCFGSGGETLRNVRTMENMALCNKSKSNCNDGLSWWFTQSLWFAQWLSWSWSSSSSSSFKIANTCT